MASVADRRSLFSSMIVPPLAAHRMIRKRLAGHAVGAGPTSNRTHGPVTRHGDVQLPDVAHAARERGAQLAGLDNATDLVAASTACNDDVITL
jgi:hypothetical protein